MTTSYRATRIIEAAPADVFAVLCDPGRHSDIDALESVLRPVTEERIERVGQIFTMNMVYEDGEQAQHYRTDNHVVVFEPATAIGWATSLVGEAPLGWTWRYDLAPQGDGTAVTLTYDCIDAAPENVRTYGVPVVGPDGLAESLQLLAAQVR